MREWWENITGETPDALARAGRDVDTLTFCRIRVQSWERLTPFQQGTVSEVVKGLAQFQSANAEMLDSTMSGYSINGVSVQYTGGMAVTRVGGVVIPRRLYALLEQTGLTYPVLRG